METSEYVIFKEEGIHVFFFGSFLWGNIKQVGFTWMYPENSREQAAARMAGGCCVCFHVVAVNIS